MDLINTLYAGTLVIFNIIHSFHLITVTPQTVDYITRIHWGSLRIYITVARAHPAQPLGVCQKGYDLLLCTHNREQPQSAPETVHPCQSTLPDHISAECLGQK